MRIAGHRASATPPAATASRSSRFLQTLPILNREIANCHFHGGVRRDVGGRDRTARRQWRNAAAVLAPDGALGGSLLDALFRRCTRRLRPYWTSGSPIRPQATSAAPEKSIQE